MLKPKELLQLMREVNLSQVRKQIRIDQKSKIKSYRSWVLEGFFTNTKKRKS